MAQEEQEQIRINGATLTEGQLAEIESTYGVRPISGEYWYDAQSGLYGVMGQFSAGFMLPGHEFGALARDASAGNTGIIGNGRELPQLEWMLLRLKEGVIS